MKKVSTFFLLILLSLVSLTARATDYIGAWYLQENSTQTYVTYGTGQWGTEANLGTEGKIVVITEATDGYYLQFENQSKWLGQNSWDSQCFADGPQTVYTITEVEGGITISTGNNYLTYSYDETYQVNNVVWGSTATVWTLTDATIDHLKGTIATLTSANPYVGYYTEAQKAEADAITDLEALKTWIANTATRQLDAEKTYHIWTETNTKSEYGTREYVTANTELSQARWNTTATDDGSQDWTITALEDGGYAIKNVLTGKYIQNSLAASGGPALVDEASAWTLNFGSISQGYWQFGSTLFADSDTQLTSWQSDWEGSSIPGSSEWTIEEIATATADATPIKITFPLTDQGSVSVYTSIWTGLDAEGRTWTFANFNNNSNAWAYIKCGSKSAASVATITTPVINAVITTISVTVDATANVNSCTLIGYDSENKAVTTNEVTLTAGVNNIAITTPATGLYYVLRIDNAQKSNGSTQISAIGLYAQGDETPENPLYEDFKSLQAAATTKTQGGRITFKNAVVQGVNANGNSAYLIDEDGYGALIYASDNGFEVGDVISGTTNGAFLLYGGKTEITNVTSTSEGLTVTKGEAPAATVTTIDQLTVVNQGALVTIKGLTYTGSNNVLTDGTSNITLYNALGLESLPELSTEATYTITGIFVLYNTTVQLAPRSNEDVVEVKNVKYEPITIAINSGIYQTKSANLFVNGSFDDGVNGWQAANYTTNADISNFTWTETGGYDDGAYITTNAAGAAAATTLCQKVAVENGKTYYFAVYTGGNAINAGNYNYNALFNIDDEGKENGVIYPFTYGSETWNLSQTLFTAESNYVGVRMSWNSGANWDGFQLYEVEFVQLDASELLAEIETAQTQLAEYNTESNEASVLSAAITTAQAFDPQKSTLEELQTTISDLKAAETQATKLHRYTALEVTPADFAAGDYIIQNVYTGTFLGGANAWGTQASLVAHGQRFTLAKIEDGIYTLDSHTYNSATSHFFNGTYVDGAATNIELLVKNDGTGVNILYNSKYVGAPTEGTVIAESTEPGDAYLWKIISYDDLLTSATEDTPADATPLIKGAAVSRNLYNPSYEAVWTKQGYETTDATANSNLGGGANENQCAESWKSSNGFDIFQTITVPNGIYVLKAQAACNDYDGAGNIPVLYANDSTVSFNLITGGENSMTEMSTSFTSGLYTTEEARVIVTDGQLTVGVKCSNTNIWAIWDNFELTYYAPEVSYSVAGSFNNWSTDTNTMTKGEDGNYTATVNVTESKTYEFKVVKDGSEWIGPDGVNQGGNYSFYVSDAGDVTISYNTTTGEVTVTGDNVTEEPAYAPETITIAGSFNDWSVTALALTQNEETQEWAGTTELEAGTYEFKFTDGSWDLSWGTSETVTPDTTFALTYSNAGNISITLSEKSNVTFHFTVDAQKNAQFSYSVEAIEEANEFTFVAESYIGSSYEGLKLEVDLDAILASIEATSMDDVTIYYEEPNGTRTASVRGDADGWHDAEGYFLDWNSKPDFYVQDDSSLPGSVYYLGGYPGKTNELTRFTGKLVYVNDSTNAEATVYIVLQYVELPDLTGIVYADLTEELTVEYAAAEGDYAERVISLSEEQVNAICEKLSIESLDQASVYGYNPTTKELIFNTSSYDGWRDANGDFMTWNGSEESFCVKYYGGTDFYCYNITATTENHQFVGYWAIANATGYVLVQINFSTATGINGISSEDAIRTIYNLNGVRLNKAQKGINIINGKKVMVK